MSKKVTKSVDVTLGKKTAVDIDENDFGELIELALAKGLSDHEYWGEKALRVAKACWPALIPYYQRHRLTQIEVALALNAETPATHPLVLREGWEAFVLAHRPPKSSFTIDYHCDACGGRDRKLWRLPHGSADKNGRSLLCAACLSPEIRIGNSGRRMGPYGLSDQIDGWLPAVPVDDTFWGYSSVPSSDVLWWKALPTYPEAP